MLTSSIVIIVGLVLALVMLAHGFSIGIPDWISPLATFMIVGYFFVKSWRTNRQAGE